MKKEKTSSTAAATAGSNRKWIFRIAALLIVLVICVIMFIIGRGHTVYFDNTKMELNGKTIEPFHKVDVIVKAPLMRQDVTNLIGGFTSEGLTDQTEEREQPYY